MRRLRLVPLTLALVLVLALCELLIVSGEVRGEEISVDITSGRLAPIPFGSEIIEGERKLGSILGSIIVNNLNFSGYFTGKGSGVGGNKGIDIRYWRREKVHFVIDGQVGRDKEGYIVFELQLWNVLSGEVVLAKKYRGKEETLRRLGHIATDHIFQRILGKEGYFDSNIAYIQESGSKKKRKKSLVIMDQDGYNRRTLLAGKENILTPRFSSDGSKIAYISLSTGEVKVWILERYTGKRVLVGSFAGMTFAPRFSPSDSHIVLSRALNGNTDIFTVRLADNKVRRLTRSKAIDTSPSYSADGKSIVFTSDRGGTPQLYVMDNNGKGKRRISYGDGYYTTPVWSPDGRHIAFTKQRQGGFYIGIMSSDGSGERLLVRGNLLEGPAWSPNGLAIVYTEQNESRRGKTFLKVIDFRGFTVRTLSTSGEASDASWSKLKSH